MQRVLVLDSDDASRMTLCAHLLRAGMDARGISTGAQLNPALSGEPFDVVVCDVQLADESGFSVAARLRLSTNAGLILLTGIEKREDRILALSVGVDHYLVRPVDLRELEMLIGNLHRRSVGSGILPMHGLAARPRPWVFDAVRWKLMVPEGEAVSLSLAEYLILGCLLTRIGEVVSREELLTAMDRRDVRAYSRNIDMIISRLRRKVAKASSEKLPVLSARGAGYVFTGLGKYQGDSIAPSLRLR